MIRRLALSMCGIASAFAAEAAVFSFPAADIADRKALWSAVMTHFYGPYDSTQKCWKKTGKAPCMRPHRLDEATEEGVRRLFVVAAGKGEETCHGCGGNISLLVLDVRDDKLVLGVSGSLDQAAGAWGEPPAEESFRLRRIASNGHGWTMETGYTGQGITQGGEVVYGLVDGTIVELGYIPTFADTCGYNPDDCGSWAFDLTFEGGSGPFFDAEATVKPDSDRPKGPATVKVPFNAQSMKYDIPEGLTFLQH